MKRVFCCKFSLLYYRVVIEESVSNIVVEFMRSGCIISRNRYFKFIFFGIFSVGD